MTLQNSEEDIAALIDAYIEQGSGPIKTIQGVRKETGYGLVEGLHLVARRVAHHIRYRTNLYDRCVSMIGNTAARSFAEEVKRRL